MTTINPITPPLELVDQWRRSGPADAAVNNVYELHIARQAAQWGADQELDECCEALTDKCFNGQATLLREWRRPKPPSLKEQALEALGPEPRPETGPTGDTILNCGAIERHRLVRRALEALDD